jgi:hypothetical protein
LTGEFPSVGLTTEDFTVGQAVIKLLQAKWPNIKECFDNQHMFIISFVFDTFGFRSPMNINILKRVQRVMHSNVMSSRFLNVVFKKIDFTVIQRISGTTLMLVCHPFNIYNIIIF